ncbi:hypothetical protein [Burkholderia sp. PU8-34]
MLLQVIAVRGFSGVPSMLARYAHAFDHLQIGLAIVTLRCAAVVFVFLGGRRRIGT